ncbi:aldo/keto reductase family protein [Ceratobasidium sp. AG-Ba]|nr:aldo/keto reductase family protein [Ceratobasidium sp. AG-Ba]
MVVKNSDVKLEFDPKNMQFRRLGASGLRVPVFSLGGWLTFGGTVKGDPVKEIVKLAFDNGINMIDVAESYSKGESEREIGRVIEELGIRRSDLVLSSKIFFGQSDRRGPNDKGLSRKHIVEGMNEILERLRTDYVDIIFAHRPDPTVPMEEIVRAFNYLIDSGKAFYWATSEWSARQVEEAHHVASALKLIAPIAEQVQYNCLHRQRFEAEYKYLYDKYGYGTTIWSPLASGVLTGKYNDGIPAGSRYDTNPVFFKDAITRLSQDEGKQKILKVKELTKLAETELGCSITILALAWAASHPNASTVILGASTPEQLTENLKALEIIKKITPELREKIDKVLDNVPASEPNLRPL